MVTRRHRPATAIIDACRIILSVELARRDRAKVVLLSLVLLSVAVNVLMVLHLDIRRQHHNDRAGSGGSILTTTFLYDRSTKALPARPIIAAKPASEQKLILPRRQNKRKSATTVPKTTTTKISSQGTDEEVFDRAGNPAIFQKQKRRLSNSTHSTTTSSTLKSLTDAGAVVPASSTAHLQKTTAAAIIVDQNSTTAAASTKNVVPAENTRTLTAVSVVKRPSRVNADSRDDNQLHCEVFGGPFDDASLQDMMYWRTDDEFALDETAKMQQLQQQQSSSSFSSSFSALTKLPQQQQQQQPTRTKRHYYLIFEPDEAGFSNVRLSFENVVALAKITGRILVMPPATRLVQLLQQRPPQQRRNHDEGSRGDGDNENDKDDRDMIPAYQLADFFRIRNLHVITMQEFLETVPLTYRANGTRAIPPHNRTNWDGRLGNALQSDPGDGPLLYGWLNSTMPTYEWDRERHIVVVGNGTLAHQAMAAILEKERELSAEAASSSAAAAALPPGLALLQQRVMRFFGKPPAVDASLVTRLHEFMGNRTELRTTSAYDDEPFMMMQGHEATTYRPLIQFYADYFFEDWHKSLWLKRYIRDNLRYADFIQCAAARIVHALREQARRNGNDNGSFDTMHIRRKDFRTLPNYRAGTVPAANLVRDRYFAENRTLYIATDESDPLYVQPLRKHYHVYLLQDFLPLVQGIDPNYYGMIEQLVCAKGDMFVGTFYSTFTAYITRLRGYYALKYQKPGHLLGSLTDSEYFGHKGVHRHILRQYVSPTYQLWTREWSMAWRDIDHDLNDR